MIQRGAMRRAERIKKMQIINAENQTRAAGPEAYFSGKVQVNGLFSMPAPATAAAAIVTFDTWARTAWHTHPRGQLLFILSGTGWVQSKGQPKQTVRAGDTVWFDANELHWHGATNESSMTHVAIQQSENGSAVDWADLVADADYLG